MVFRFLPGEKILHEVGWPGPDLDDCEVIEDDGGPTVLVRYQVYGRGPFHEWRRDRKMLHWIHGGETSIRFRKFKALNGE